jgi:hypothetical protein
VLLDDAEDGGQAKPGALARLLGREERLEDPREMLAGDARIASRALTARFMITWSTMPGSA